MAKCGACGAQRIGGATECTSCGNAFAAGAPETIMLRNPPAPRRQIEPPTPPPIPRSRWRTVLSSDPTEQSFLVAIRARPDDSARAVYADWLEERGDSQRATFVRHEGRLTDRRLLLGADDAEWRTIVSRTKPECARADCSGRWDTFAADPTDEQLRTCQNCALAVRYCATQHHVEHAAWTQAPYVLDADLLPHEATNWHYQALRARARFLDED